MFIIVIDPTSELFIGTILNQIKHSSCTNQSSTMINLIQILVVNIDCNNIMWIFLLLKIHTPYIIHPSSISYYFASSTLVPQICFGPMSY
jgi:hypothetical protein